MRIENIPTGDNPPESLNVIIEVPTGGEPVKYEFDKDSGALFVDRILHTPMRYPANYGFIPHTLSYRLKPFAIPNLFDCLLVYISKHRIIVTTHGDITVGVINFEMRPRMFTNEFFHRYVSLVRLTHQLYSWI